MERGFVAAAATGSRLPARTAARPTSPISRSAMSAGLGSVPSPRRRRPPPARPHRPTRAPRRPRAAPSCASLSVLFVDLVGYTALSESRDAEDVRDLLGHYFEQAKTIIDRYGGTIEKFIGDAVMAVWGVPVAREDDAERAVRAGLELVEAVERFGRSRRAVCAPGPGSSPARSPRSRIPARVSWSATASTPRRGFRRLPTRGACSSTR